MPVIRRGDVYVDTQELRDLAGDFNRWVDEIEKFLPDLRSMRFTPGSVDNAFALKERFEDRVRNGYVASVNNLKESFLDIAKELALVAKGYEENEDATTADVTRLAELLAAARKPFQEESPTPGNQNSNSQNQNND